MKDIQEYRLPKEFDQGTGPLKPGRTKFGKYKSIFYTASPFVASAIAAVVLIILSAKPYASIKAMAIHKNNANIEIKIHEANENIENVNWILCDEYINDDENMSFLLDHHDILQEGVLENMQEYLDLLGLEPGTEYTIILYTEIDGELISLGTYTFTTPSSKEAENPKPSIYPSASPSVSPSPSPTITPTSSPSGEYLYYPTRPTPSPSRIPTAVTYTAPSVSSISAKIIMSDYDFAYVCIDLGLNANDAVTITSGSIDAVISGNKITGFQTAEITEGPDIFPGILATGDEKTFEYTYTYTTPDGNTNTSAISQKVTVGGLEDTDQPPGDDVSDNPVVYQVAVKNGGIENTGSGDVDGIEAEGTVTIQSITLYDNDYNRYTMQSSGYTIENGLLKFYLRQDDGTGNINILTDFKTISIEYTWGINTTEGYSMDYSHNFN